MLAAVKGIVQGNTVVKYRVLKSIEESSKGYCYSVKLSTEKSKESTC